MSHFDRAMLLIEQGRFDMAQQELGRELGEDPDDGVSHAMLGLCLAQEGKMRQAILRAKEGVRLDPDIGLTHYMLAKVLLLDGQLKLAEASIVEAIELEPYDETNFVLRGQIQLRRRQWDKAAESAEEALALEPENVDALNVRAEALRNLGRPGVGQQQLRDALAVAPNDPETHENLGWHYILEEEDPEKAIAHFREALRINPNWEPARQGILETLKGRNVLYRLFLKFLFWLHKLGTGKELLLGVGLLVAYIVAERAAETSEALGVMCTPILFLFWSFYAIVLFGIPLSNLLLRLHPLGRVALTEKERLHSTCVGGLFIATFLVYLAMKYCGGGVTSLGWRWMIGIMVMTHFGFLLNRADYLRLYVMYCVGVAMLGFLPVLTMWIFHGAVWLDILPTVAIYLLGLLWMMPKLALIFWIGAFATFWADEIFDFMESKR